METTLPTALVLAYIKRNGDQITLRELSERTGLTVEQVADALDELQADEVPSAKSIYRT